MWCFIHLSWRTNCALIKPTGAIRTVMIKDFPISRPSNYSTPNLDEIVFLPTSGLEFLCLQPSPVSLWGDLTFTCHISDRAAGLWTWRSCWIWSGKQTKRWAAPLERGSNLHYPAAPRWTHCPQGTADKAIWITALQPSLWGYHMGQIRSLFYMEW